MSMEMSKERTAQVEMMIRFFNMQASTSYKVSIEKNRHAVNLAIERANNDIVKLKNYVRSYVQEHQDNNIVECFECFEPKEEYKENYKELKI